MSFFWLTVLSTTREQTHEAWTFPIRLSEVLHGYPRCAVGQTWHVMMDRDLSAWRGMVIRVEIESRPESFINAHVLSVSNRRVYAHSELNGLSENEVFKTAMFPNAWDRERAQRLISEGLVLVVPDSVLVVPDSVLDDAKNDEGLVRYRLQVYSNSFLESCLPFFYRSFPGILTGIAEVLECCSYSVGGSGKAKMFKPGKRGKNGLVVEKENTRWPGRKLQL